MQAMQEQMAKVQEQAAVKTVSGTAGGGIVTVTVNGAMDLVSGAGRVIVLMEHVTKTGGAKLVEECSLPLTGKRVVSRVVTDLGVLDVAGGAFDLVELAPVYDHSDQTANTASKLIREMILGWVK